MSDSDSDKHERKEQEAPPPGNFKAVQNIPVAQKKKPDKK
jgi:hypothetical protein